MEDKKVESECYLVESYSNDNLLEIFRKASKVQNIEANLHYRYLCKYLYYTECKTMVLETEYIDKYYLDDYAEYFVKCFEFYDRFCFRLHFFKSDFSQEKYQQHLLNIESDKNQLNLNDNYLGFIVIKPIPTAFIGRTCLRTYTDKDSRHYDTTRKYDVNLHGHKLSVKSLAYQEQDRVVSACATTALWTSFQGTAFLFQHSIPTPITITKNSTQNMPIRNRSIPSNGLTSEEMIRAINLIGLEAEYFDVRNDVEKSSNILIKAVELFKAVVYSYTKFGIPVILGCRLKNIDTNTYIGFHAVSITGFNIDKINQSNSYINLFSNNIDKIYVHDDQVGPFAMCEIKNEEVEVDFNSKRKVNYPYYLSSEWQDKNNKSGNIVIIPELVIVPVYHKIRIQIDDMITNISRLAKRIANKLDIDTNIFNWDLELSTIEKFKTQLIKDMNAKSNDKERILTRNLPKYIWVAKLSIDNKLSVTYIFDATDIKTNGGYLEHIFYLI